MTLTGKVYPDGLDVAILPGSLDLRKGPEFVLPIFNV